MMLVDHLLKSLLNRHLFHMERDSVTHLRTERHRQTIGLQNAAKHILDVVIRGGARDGQGPIPRNVANRGGGSRGPQCNTKTKTANKALSHEASHRKKPRDIASL